MHYHMTTHNTRKQHMTHKKNTKHTEKTHHKQKTTHNTKKKQITLKKTHKKNTHKKHQITTDVTTTLRINTKLFITIILDINRTPRITITSHFKDNTKD